jgi:hypothetical protein
MMVALAQRIQDGNHEQQSLFDSVVGQLKTHEKRWIVDIDTKEQSELYSVINYLHTVRPEGDKVESIIPTKNGYHLITKRFDILEFNKAFSHIDIQKKNPTLLYYPNSLDNEN